jgi:hypothetical protein
MDLQDFFAKAKIGFTGLYTFGGCVFRPPMKIIPLNGRIDFAYAKLFF